MFKRFTWYQLQDNDYICGIDKSIGARAIADCLSASLPIPLETDAIFEESQMIVEKFIFNEIEEPVDWWRKDRFYYLGGLS